MNANEVLGLPRRRRPSASPVHPNDHVNASQSSNDVFPSAIHIAATDSLVNSLIPSLRHLELTLARPRPPSSPTVVKSGRTHLMDATPVTLGQEFGGYAAQIRYGVERIEAALPRVAELPLGGTAVGTGINTPPGFAAAVIDLLAEETRLPFTEARDHFEAQGARDGLVEASGVLRTIAVSLNKIANDLRWMGSGPRAGLGEILLPDLQPGSSIMPGKVNPVMCEAAMMVCAQVIGNDTAVAIAGASGNFELNVMLPVIARNVLESSRLLANVSRLLADRCVAGIVAQVEHCRAAGRVIAVDRHPAEPLPRLRERGGRGEDRAEGEQDHPAGRDRVRLRRGGQLTEQLDAALDVLAMTRRPFDSELLAPSRLDSSSSFLADELSARSVVQTCRPRYDAAAT